MNPKLAAKLKGYFIPNIVALAIIALTRYFDTFGNGVIVFSEFIIIPLFIGYASAYYWRNLNATGGILAWWCVVNTFIAIALSAIVLHEGAICLIIVSPLIASFVFVGAFMGRTSFKRDDNTLNISLLSLMLLVFVGDSLSEHHYENMVSDTLVVNAPPDKVWPHVVSFKRIKAKENYWLFRAGMPSPCEATVTGHYKGAGRKCIFSNGYVFDERIATYERNKDLTFEITDQPRDPEIMGHIDILKGQFLLQDNHDGTTTLVGNSWYRLYVFPTWYYDVWARSVTRNVHYRVMEHIKELSESR